MKGGQFHFTEKEKNFVEKRLQEVISTVFGAAELIVVIYLLVQRFQLSSLPYVILFAFLGILTADLLSGLVHWAADSFGTVDTFIGRVSVFSNFNQLQRFISFP